MGVNGDFNVWVSFDAAFLAVIVAANRRSSASTIRKDSSLSLFPLSYNDWNGKILRAVDYPMNIRTSLKIAWQKSATLPANFLSKYQATVSTNVLRFVVKLRFSSNCISTVFFLAMASYKRRGPQLALYFNPGGGCTYSFLCFQQLLCCFAFF